MLRITSLTASIARLMARFGVRGVGRVISSVFTAGFAVLSPPSIQEPQEQGKASAPSSSSSSSTTAKMLPRQMQTQQPVSQETDDATSHAPKKLVPAPSQPPKCPPVACPASPRLLATRQVLPVGTLDVAPNVVLSRQGRSGTTAHTMTHNIAASDTIVPSSGRENLSLQPRNSNTDQQMLLVRQPRRPLRQETGPIAARIPPKSTPARQGDQVVKPHKGPKSVPSWQEPHATAGHTTLAAKPAKRASSSVSPRPGSRLQGCCKAHASRGGEFSKSQNYETALAELRNTRRELSLMRQQCSETIAEVKKAEASVRAFRNIAKTKNLKLNLIYKSEAMHYQIIGEACLAELAGMGRKIHRLRSKEIGQMRAVGVDFVFPVSFTG